MLPFWLGGGVLAIIASAFMATQCSQGEKQLGKALDKSYSHGKTLGDIQKKLGRCEKARDQKALKEQLKHDREMRKLDIKKWKKANKELWEEVNVCIKQYKKLKKSCK